MDYRLDHGRNFFQRPIPTVTDQPVAEAIDDPAGLVAGFPASDCPIPARQPQLGPVQLADEPGEPPFAQTLQDPTAPIADAKPEFLIGMGAGGGGAENRSHQHRGEPEYEEGDRRLTTTRRRFGACVEPRDESGRGVVTS